MIEWVVLLLALLQIATLVVLLVRPRRSLDDRVAEADTDEPTATSVLRHEHRFGPKDEDGVRHCRCGDRYLDGMRV